MKKSVLIFMAMAILCCSMFGASAANYYPREDSKGNYSYSITCDVTKLDGVDTSKIENGKSMYALVAVKGTGASINLAAAESFVYIDQATIKNGKITFSGFLPMGPDPDDLENFEECTLFVGGAGLSSAKAIGVLKDASGVAVEGVVTDTVTSANSSKVTTVTAKNEAGEVVGAPVTTSATGAYTLTVPAGTYSLVFTKDGFLSFTLTGVDAAAGLTGVNVDISNLAGDVDGNGEVKLPDIQALIKDYDKSTGLTNANSDVDDNGEVKLPDIQALIKAYDKSNVTQAYSAK